MPWSKFPELTDQWRFYPGDGTLSIVRLDRVKRGVYEMRIPNKPGRYAKSAPIRLEHVSTLPEAQAAALAITRMQRSE